MFDTAFTREIIPELRKQAEEAQSLPKVLAVDFDDTLTVKPKGSDPIDYEFELRPGMKEKILEHKKAGWETILFTVRSDEVLAPAVKWLKGQGLVFDAVNDNSPSWKPVVAGWRTKGTNGKKDASNKPYYDILVDDRNKTIEQFLDEGVK